MTFSEKESSQYSPLTLAYLGDAVFELFVRERLVSLGSMPAKKFRTSATDYVSAHAQSGFYEKIKDTLTEEENAVFHRGRNCGAQGNKNTDPAEYARATGLEAVFGYLWLSGNERRARELFEQMTGETSES